MAPIAIDTIDEAPSSPRTAALYYWGGGGGGGKDNNWNEDENTNCNITHVQTQQQRSDVSTLREYTTISGDGGRQYHQRHQRRPVIKFHLEMDDEDDDNHWMFLRRPAYKAAATDNLVPAPSNQVQNRVSVETTTADETTEEEDKNNDGDFSSIPVINLEQPLETYAKQIGDACRNIGFFYIINHGIDESIMEDVMDASKRLFHLDLESKIALTGGRNDNGREETKKGYRGYFGIGAEDLDNKDGTRDLESEERHGLKKKMSKMKGDFKEGFDVGLERQDDLQGGENVDNACHSFFGRNVWPDENKHGSVIGFRQSLLRYQDELLKLSDKLMVAFAMSLSSDNGAIGLPLDYFVTRTRHPMSTLRLLHYPPSLDVSNSGCGAHTDYGLFTILQQDGIGGLQVRNHSKKWINAKPLRGSFVINVGDMLSHWTSGVYASTVHRVVSPSSSSGYHRYSVPYFFNPDHDAVVEPIILNDNGSGDDCDGDGGRCSSKRRSIALEILQARYNGTFQSDN